LLSTQHEHDDLLDLADVTLARFCVHDSQLLLATPHRLVDVTNLVQANEAAAWWTELLPGAIKGEQFQAA
jgi:hypothetical protein